MLLEGEMLRRRRYAQCEVLDICYTAGRKGETRGIIALEWSRVNPHAREGCTVHVVLPGSWQ